MAKSSSFFGMRKGSTKSMTYSVLKGQQITKDRVTEVANPKTPSQMVQRMIFANAVKFFKHGQAGFFKFAFEDKKAKESDYNAFMRHNAKNAVAVSYPDYKDPAYPAFGRYMLTQGSLPTPIVDWNPNNQSVRLAINVGADGNTIGELSSYLLEKYPSLMEGDIVTILLVHTSLKSDGAMTDERVNRWDIRQFVIDSKDTRDADATLGAQWEETSPYVLIANLGGDSLDTTVAKGAAVIFSRNTPNGLKCSTSEIIPNGVAAAKMTAMSTPVAIDAAATTWGAVDPAILQGALVK